MNILAFVGWYIGMGVLMFVGVVGYGIARIIPPVIRYRLSPEDSKTFMLMQAQMSGIDGQTTVMMAVNKLIFWPLTLTDYGTVISTYEQIRTEFIEATERRAE